MPGVIGFGGAAKELGFDRRTNVWFERGEGLEQAVQTDPVRLRGIVTKLFTPWPVDHAVARVVENSPSAEPLEFSPGRCEPFASDRIFVSSIARFLTTIDQLSSGRQRR